MIVLDIIATILTLYSFLILFRIIMTWLPDHSFGRPQELIGRAVDPYLDVFRRTRLLRIGYVDASPVLGIILLYVVIDVLRSVSVTGTISLGLVLGMFVLRAGNALVFLLGILLLVTVIRLVMLLANARANRFTMVLDQLLQPIAYRAAMRLAGNRFRTYTHALGLTAALNLVAVIGGSFVVRGLATLLLQMPI